MVLLLHVKLSLLSPADLITMYSILGHRRKVEFDQKAVYKIVQVFYRFVLGGKYGKCFTCR